MQIKPKSVRRVFLFFIFYLPFQYMLVGIIGVIYSEPWPAFVLPGFKSVLANQDQVEIVEPRFFAISIQDDEKKYHEISSRHLFEGLPESQLQGFIRTNFTDHSEFTPAARQWLNQRVRQFYPGKQMTALEVRWVAIQYSQSDEQNEKTLQTFSIEFKGD